MELQIPSNKIYNHPQTLMLDNKVITFVGENGCGKSAILESIFTKYLDDNQNDTRLISFSSGNNESFSSIFQNSIRSKQRFIVNNFDDEEKFENAINVFYFDKSWVRLLIFFATALKRNGKVIDFLKSKNLVDVNGDGVDITTMIGFPFRVRKYYVDKIIEAVRQESLSFEYDARSIRNTFFHEYLTKLTEKIYSIDFDFEIENSRIVKTWRRFRAEDAAIVLGTDSNKIFSFFAWATLYNNFIFRDEIELYFKGNLELNQLSDGEHQLLAIYSLIDLFDTNNTLFLLDEVDSHLYYRNIQKMWDLFANIEGKIITTTHSADSVILNQFENIKLIEAGKIEDTIVADKVLHRLESLSSGGNYKLTVAGKVKYLVLVEDYFDWFIFLELCKKKVDNYNDAIQKNIHYIKCSAGFNTYAERFGNAKLDWVESFKRHNSNPDTKVVFLICDRDNLSIGDITDRCLVTRSEHNKRENTISIKGQDKVAYLMSWRRREIENYLLSHTMLSAYAKLDNVNDKLPRTESLIAGEPNDTESVRILDVKKVLQPLYLKDSISNDDSGIDYDKLAMLIAAIPKEEISEDIKKAYEFIISKIQ